MKATKTTFMLDQSLLVRLKVAAAQGQVTIREMLIEGAEMVLEKHETKAYRDILKRIGGKKRRASSSRRQLS
jgi:hypothetical protein